MKTFYVKTIVENNIVSLPGVDRLSNCELEYYVKEGVVIVRAQDDNTAVDFLAEYDITLEGFKKICEEVRQKELEKASSEKNFLKDTEL